ncbi:hypothetical protein CR513_47505, partial [Mucuna pruriens]
MRLQPKVNHIEAFEYMKIEFDVYIDKSLKEARTIIKGTLKEHYAHIWDYAHKLLRTNPRSTIKIDCVLVPESLIVHETFQAGLVLVRIKSSQQRLNMSRPNEADSMMPTLSSAVKMSTFVKPTPCQGISTCRLHIENRLCRTNSVAESIQMPTSN